ncbi:MAG: hypothetical protein WA688_01480 [Thermoplasmata archaeon]
MRLKAATAGLVAVALLVTAGTGFAAFTSSAYVNGTATAGTLGPLVWGTSPTQSESAASVVCGATLGSTLVSGDTLVLTAGNLAPGQECSYADTIDNMGSLPAAATEQVTYASGTLCAVLVYQDTFFSPPTTIGTGGQTGPMSNIVPPGPAFVWGGDIRLSGSASNAYQDTSCSFTVTLTGTAGT